MRAISRRTGLKVEMVMASGVSSMIRSTPVSVSIARMLRPSRPMMRPFISSFGRSTTETVASDTESAAQRWMARVMMFLAFSSAVSLYCCSISESFCAISWRASVSTRSSRVVRASSTVIPETRCSSSTCDWRSCSISSRSASLSRIFFSSVFSFFSKLSSFLSKFSSF